jgi:preprotein translocase subunit SecB
MEEERNDVKNGSIPFLHFSVQLQSVFAIEINAKRFPVVQKDSNSSNVENHLSIEGIEVNEELSVAQAILSVQVFPTDEQRLFEIAFKQVGLFTYSKDYSPEMVQTFLQQGSLSVMLPFAREMLASICTRLHIPTVLLPMIPIAPTTINSTSKTDVH